MNFRGTLVASTKFGFSKAYNVFKGYLNRVKNIKGNNNNVSKNKILLKIFG